MSRAVVRSFDELVRRPFAGGVNALRWPRELEGDFAEITRLLAPVDGVRNVDAEMLRDLELTLAGRIAADVILEDLRRLEELGREPVLNCIASYERDERGLPISTDVLSFHADRAPVEYDTWLCTYWGRSSEGVANADARRLIDDPAIYSALRRHYAGETEERFAEIVREESFDLHYRVVADAAPFAFGVGDLWKIAVDWPGSAVPPCLHRAPLADGPRLLLIC